MWRVQRLTCALCLLGWCCVVFSNAGIQAVSDCELWALDRPTFRRIIVRAAARVINSKVTFLKRCVWKVLRPLALSVCTGRHASVV